MNDDFGFQQTEYTTPEPHPEGHANGYAITSLVCGIVALVLTCCCCCLFVLAIIPAVLAIVFACLAKRDNGGIFSGKACAGLILGIIAIVLFVILCAVSIIYGMWFNSIPQTPAEMRAYLQELEKMYPNIDFSEYYQIIDEMEAAEALQ